MITFTPLGGGREIGANGYLVNLDGVYVLLDAGMHPSRMGPEALLDLEKIPKKLDAVILSHAHFDHIGSLPYLFHEREIGRILLTDTSLDIVQRMLRNTAATIRNHYPELWSRPEYSGYHREELSCLFGRLKDDIQPYLQRFHLAPDIHGFFFDAGHVLGSAGVVLINGDGDTVVYTGDIALKKHGVHPPARFNFALGSVSCLMIEATTAEEDRSTRPEEEIQSFFTYLEDAYHRRARALIPAFALGRTQDVLALIQQGREAGRIGDMPVYVIGLGNAITELYDRQPPDRLIRLFTRKDRLKEIGEAVDTSDLEAFYRNLKREGRPAIFVATNGMLQAGTPSATLAARMVADPEETIIFSGYQAPGSLGHDVLKSGPGVTLDFIPGKPPVTVKTDRIYTIDLSAHASRKDLLNIVRQFNPDHTIVIHGSEAAVTWLADRINKSGGDAVTPRNGEMVALGLPGELVLKPLTEVPAVIVTVGTSLLGAWRKSGSGGSTCTPGDLAGVAADIARQSKSGGRQASAEIQTLEGMNLRGDERLYFLAGDSPEGRLCAEGLRNYYAGRGWQAEVRTVADLRVEVDAFRDRGLPNLVNVMADIINTHHKNVRLVATGGYKAETAMANLVGVFFNVPVHYIHEDQRHVITFAQLPLTPNFQLLQGQISNVERVLEATPEKGWRMVRNNFPPALEVLFQERADGKGLELSPMGRVFMNLFRHSRGRSESHLDRITASRRQPTLWGLGTIRITDIPDPEIRLILERVALQDDFIEKITLRGPVSPGGTDGPALIFREKQKNRLYYDLTTRKGCQTMCLHCWMGTEEAVLKRLGKRIYP